MSHNATSTTHLVRSRSEEVLERRASVVPRGVGHMSRIVADRAEGPYVFDIDGRRYIDFAAGIGTLNIGHRHPLVMERIREQLERLHHVAVGVAITELYVAVAEKLCEVIPGRFEKKAILLNSGAEAVENAVKIARAYTGRPAIVAFDGAFHGRTLLTTTLTGKAKPYKVTVGPFAPEVYHAPYAYPYRSSTPEDPLACAQQAAQGLEDLFTYQVASDSVAAVIIEPVQGEGGFIVPPPEFLRRVQGICRKHGILLIADEIQTGFGRTGEMFACDAVGLEPDLICIGKSVADGMPLSAVVGRAEVMDGPIPGSLGGTYTGNPIACAAALGVFEAFASEDILGSARRLGEVLLSRFEEWAQQYEIIGDVRGMGAMVALELVRDRSTKEPASSETQFVLNHCQANGLLVIKAGIWDNVVRMLMPLNVPAAVLEEGLQILEQGISAADSERIRQ